jgi:glycosyltransferase involved in cell wall biosynthesis
VPCRWREENQRLGGDTQEHKGLSAARNAGIRHSSGDYIVPLDADDQVASGFLASARAALDRHPDIAYLAGYARYTGLLNHTMSRPASSPS